MTAPLLEVDGLSAGYGEVPVLSQIKLTVSAGEMAALPSVFVGCPVMAS